MARETFDSGGKKVPVELFQPAGAGKRPAVVVAYGTEGMNDPFGKDIQSFASDLAGKGYVVLIPHYFDRTDTQAGPAAFEAFVGRREIWLDTLGDALAYAASRGEVKADQIGLLGFSMGGHLALRRAKMATGVKVKGVVEFFAPITMQPFHDLGGDIDKLPPIQIHHGDGDQIVWPKESREFKSLLVAAGKREGRDFEIYFYPGEGHGFRGVLAVNNSKQRTRDFFDKHLG